MAEKRTGGVAWGDGDTQTSPSPEASHPHACDLVSLGTAQSPWPSKLEGDPGGPGDRQGQVGSG